MLAVLTPRRQGILDKEQNIKKKQTTITHNTKKGAEQCRLEKKRKPKRCILLYEWLPQRNLTSLLSAVPLNGILRIGALCKTWIVVTSTEEMVQESKLFIVSASYSGTVKLRLTFCNLGCLTWSQLIM